ncbi:MAG: oxidoreductase [Candidatus Odinarchaeota archaeon]
MTKKWTAENIPDLTEKIVIVTGANSGIGYETARALVRKGATVVLACRNKDKGAASEHQINQDSLKGKAVFMKLDLTDLASLRRFSLEFANHYNKLDILINNAGIMRTPFGNTVDGFELQFGTNYLGHFALTGLILNFIIRAPQSRVVTVSSGGARFGKIDFDNLNGEKGYHPGNAYGQSKLANLLFTYELQRRFEREKVDSIAVAAHPGWTAATNLPVHWRMVRLLNPIIGQKPEMGALPILYAATAPDVKGGDYYGPRGRLGLRGYPTKVQSSKRSHDIDVAVKLWSESEKLTGVPFQWK